MEEVCDGSFARCILDKICPSQKGVCGKYANNGTSELYTSREMITEADNHSDSKTAPGQANVDLTTK